MSVKRGRRVAPRLDASNLAGMTTLMNHQHIKPGINLTDIERTVMGKTNKTTKFDRDPLKIFSNEINQLTEELGINLMDDASSVSSRRSKKSIKSTAPIAVTRLSSNNPPKNDRQTPVSREITGPRFKIDDLDLEMSTFPPVKKKSSVSSGASVSSARGGMYRYDNRYDNKHDNRHDNRHDNHQNHQNHQNNIKKSNASVSSTGSEIECECTDDCSDSCDCECHEDECSCTSECSDSCDCECHEDECSCTSECSDRCNCECHEDDDSKADDVINKMHDEFGISTEVEDHHRHIPKMQLPNYDNHPREHITDEQERRRHINSIMHDIQGTNRTAFGVETERIQDMKTSKLEQISQLRMALEEEGINCENVNNPSNDSPMQEIDSILNILRLKNDRNRYSTMAEEIILGGAEAIETVFDGSRSIPLLGWKPDYTGYHNTVNVKLHRMRFETSQVVGNIIQKYNIGPTARIAMELLPSFFLYPRQNGQNRNTPGLFSHIDSTRSAMHSIRSSDERQSLMDDLRQL